MAQDFRKGKQAADVPFTDKFLYPSAAVTLKVQNRYVYPSTTSAGSAFTITLAPPELLPGEIVTFEMVARDSTKDITLSGEGFDDIVLNLAGETVVLLSRGKDYIEVGGTARDSRVLGFTTVTTDTTAGVVTYTAAELLGGFILRDPNGGARSDVSPTALLIIAAIENFQIGSSFEFTIRNTADAAEEITLTAGTGVTLSGTMTIGQNDSKRFLVVVTAATTVTIYSLGTVVF